MIFNNNKLDKFLDDSNNLEESATLRNAFSDIDLCLADITDLFRNIVKQKDPYNTLKIYVDRAIRHDFEAEVLDKEFRSEETLQAWCERVFKSKNYCLESNHGDHYSEILSRKIARAVSPLFERTKLPLGGVAISIFAGDYGFTPFGVHYDHDLSSVFHFHLGPNNKKIHLWDRETFLKETGSIKPYFDAKKILSSGHSDIIEKNDFYNLPGNYHHVGETLGYSVGIAVALVRFNQQAFFSNVLSYLNNSILRGKGTDILDHRTHNLTTCGEEQFYVQFLEHLTCDLTAPFGEVLKQAYRDYRHSILSNAGLVTASKPRNIDSSTFEKCQFIPITPFKISYYNEHGKLIYFVRRNKFVCSYHPDITKFFDKLNDGNTFLLNQVYSELKSLRKDQIINLLKGIVSYNGMDCDVKAQ